MFLLKPNFFIIELPQYTEFSHEGVLAEFGGTQREPRVGRGRGRDVRVGWEDGFVLSLVQGGGRQQARVDAHGDLVHDPTGVGQAVARVLEQRSGGAGRGEEVGDGRGGAERCRGCVGQDGGLPAQVRAPCQHRAVPGAALGQRERGAGHRGREERLLPPGGEVPVPLLQPRAEVLDLATHTETGRV